MLASEHEQSFAGSEPAPTQSPARSRPASAPHSPGSRARRALQTSRAPGCRNGEQTFCMWCERGTPTPLSFQCAFSRGRHGGRAAQSSLWGPSWPVHPTTLSGPWRCRKQCGAERRDSKPRLLRPQVTAPARGPGGRADPSAGTDLFQGTSIPARTDWCPLYGRRTWTDRAVTGS